MLAVVPASSPDTEHADRVLAAAQLVATAIEAQRPDVTVLDVEALLARSGPAGACLLDPDRPPDCLTSIYQGPWLEVGSQRYRLELRLHPGGDQLERQLPPQALVLPVERLGPTLMSQLGLAIAPPPRDQADAVPSQSGKCLESDALEPFGAGLRSLLKSRRQSGDEVVATRTGAIAKLEAAHTLSPTLLAGAWLARGRLEAGDASGAASILPDPLPSLCGIAPALAVRGDARIALGEVTDGVADLGRSALFRPYNDAALFRWAEGLALEQRWDDANQVLRRVLALEPARLDYRRRLAEVLAAGGRSREARAVLIQGLEHLPDRLDRATLELDLAQLEEADGQWRLALLHGERGLALLGDSGSTHLRASLLNGIGVAALQLGDFDAAARTLEQAVAIRRAQLAAGAPVQDRLATSLYNRGLVLAKEGRWGEARKMLEEAASRFDGEERISTLLDLARLLQQAQRSREALEVLEQTRKAGPALQGALEAEWLYLHGLSQAGAGQLNTAMAELEQAAGRFGQSGHALEEGLAWFNLGIVAARARNPERALEAYERAKELALQLGDTDSVDEIDARIHSLEPAEPENPAP